MRWNHQHVDLKKILKGVSRSFYLSLILLPKKVRLPMGLAFLACKAADTIADTEFISRGERLKLLDVYRKLFAGPNHDSAQNIASSIAKVDGGSAAERELLVNLPALMEALENLEPKDWGLIQELVLELTQGMQMDLTLEKMETEAQLEKYIYYVAGCVGRFWTRMIKNHFVFGKNFTLETEDLGERLGKGLQLVNILRDLPRDKQQGRNYIPKELPPERLLQKARNYLSSYEEYLTYYPWYTLRLKVVVRLPARLGFQTLDLLENASDWPSLVKTYKISRRQVYQTLLASLF